MVISGGVSPAGREREVQSLSDLLQLSLESLVGYDEFRAWGKANLDSRENNTKQCEEESRCREIVVSICCESYPKDDRYERKICIARVAAIIAEVTDHDREEWAGRAQDLVKRHGYH